MTTREEKVLPLEPGQLANFEARMLRNFRTAVDDWDEVSSALGTWEATRLTAENSAQAQQQHKLDLWHSEISSAEEERILKLAFP